MEPVKRQGGDRLNPTLSSPLPSPQVQGHFVGWIDDLYNAPSGCDFQFGPPSSGTVTEGTLKIYVEAYKTDVFRLYIEKNSQRAGLLNESKKSDQPLEWFDLVFTLPVALTRLHVIKLLPGTDCPLVGVARKVLVSQQQLTDGQIIRTLGNPIIDFPSKVSIEYPKIIMSVHIPFSVNAITFKYLKKTTYIYHKFEWVQDALLQAVKHQNYHTCKCLRKGKVEAIIEITVPSKCNALRIFDENLQIKQIELPEEFFTNLKKIP